MRPLVVFAGFLGVVIGLVWLPLVAMILLAVRYRAWEIVIIGLLLDFAWQPLGPFVSALPVFTVVSIILVWIFEPIRTQFLS